MSSPYQVNRTTTSDVHFQMLVNQLDNELWNELQEDQATYDQYNKVPDIQTAVVIYASEEPAAIGCFKEVDKSTVEIKRMFVEKKFRGQGLSKKVLGELEKWAIELGYQSAILETSVRFIAARNLYQSTGYLPIDKYGPYVDLPESICMKKIIVRK